MLPFLALKIINFFLNKILVQTLVKYEQKQTKGNKMKNKVKKIAGSLITATVFSTLAMSAANATTCYGNWVFNTWVYKCY